MQNISTADKAKWYEIRRNELLELIEKTSSLQIQEKYARELAEVKKKCLENQFEIVLIGEFQGGKSTTFNALCDGRDLSPRGLGGGGIKTSAAIISAQNISDGETCNGFDEWAEITFKSKYDIQAGMFGCHIHEMLAADAEFRSSVMRQQNISDEDFSAKMAMPETFAALLDLDNPVHRRAVRKCLDYWWKEWNENPEMLDEDFKDLLRIATLQERFYGTAEYKSCVENNIRGIYDFQKLIAFPSNWAVKWTAGQNARFTFEEAAFVFIGKTLLRIKSSNLATLGCRITDSPGLGANAYDTKVAKYAILQSDAVWYLIGGEKQIGEKDLESLDTIDEMGMSDKITGSVNLKGKHKQKMDQIFPATEAILKAKGFSFDLLPYNARLAFLAAQGKRIAEGTDFSDYELNCMRIDADNDDEETSMEEMWCDMVTEAGVNTGIKELKQIDTADAESVASVAKESFFNDIMTNLSEKIISQKSRSILIDNGSARAANALQEYEGILKMSEDAALQDEEKWRRTVEEEQAVLEEFIKDAKAIIDDAFPEYERKPLSSALALELVQTMLSDSELITKVATLLFEDQKANYGKFHVTKDDYKQAVVDRVTAPLRDLLRNQYIKIVNAWKKDQRTQESWWRFKSRLGTARKRILETWQEDISQREYIKQLPLHIPPVSILNHELEVMQANLMDDKEQGLLAAATEIQKEILSVILRDDFANIIGKVGDCAIDLGNRIGNFFDSDLRPEKIAQQRRDMEERIKARKIKLEHEDMQFVREKVVPMVSKTFSDLNRLSEISKEFIEYFDDLQTVVIGDIRKVLDGLLESFKNDHVDPAKRNFTLAETKRKEIAEENHRIRVEQIEPVRKKIQAFEQQVSLEMQ